MCHGVRTESGRVSLALAWALSLLVLLFSGIGYRVLASHLNAVAEDTVELPVPLSVFPVRIGSWVGKDVPIPANIQRVAGNDDFLNRLYINEPASQWANVYVAYSATPRTMLGHKPRDCYVGGGWVLDSVEESEFISDSGRRIPCLVHRFHVPGLGYEETVVLNFYIVNGRLTNDESSFSGVGWRTPNIAGDAARYVAQVQISSVLENSVRAAAEDMTELIMGFFPDAGGEVKASEY